MSTATPIAEQQANFTAPQLALAQAIVAALSDDAHPFDCSDDVPPEPSCFHFGIESCDRDFVYTTSRIPEAISDYAEKDEERASLLRSITLEHVSQHELQQDGGWSYTNIYLVQPENAVLVAEGSLGEYTDDDYDLYLHSTLTFHESPEAAEQFAHQESKGRIERALQDAFHHARSALDEAPVTISAEIKSLAKALLESFSDSLDADTPLGEGA